MGLLSGKKVVAFVINLPGPYLASQLTRLGAEVIKVEPPLGDPVARGLPDFYEKLTKNQMIQKLNFKEEQDLLKLLELVKNSDLFLSSTRPSTLKKLGLGWEQIQHLGASHLNLVGFAKPDQELSGHDLNYQAKKGVLSGTENPKVPWADMGGAILGTIDAIELLFAKNPEYRECSLADSLDPFLEPLKNGLTGEGTFLGGGLPNYKIYAAKSGAVAFGALEPKFFQNFQKAVKIDNPNFDELEKLFLTKTASEWEAFGLEKDIPITEIRN